MNVPWCCSLWKVSRMESTFSLKNKSKTIEIQEQAKGKESWIFMDTKCQVDWKVFFQWKCLFQDFQTREFQVLFQDDPILEMSKELYRNISKSGLYRVVSKPFILPCLDVIKWLTRKVNHQRRTILNFGGNHVVGYQPSMLHQMYHFKEPRIKVTQEWLQNKVEVIDYLTQMKGWWVEVNFRCKPSHIGWPTSKFQKCIKIMVILLSRIFGRKDASNFPDKWVPITHQVITSGSIMNWGEIISSNLDSQLKKV